MSPRVSVAPGQESLLERTCPACRETFAPWDEFVSQAEGHVYTSWCRACTKRKHGPKTRKAQGLTGSGPTVERHKDLAQRRSLPVVYPDGAEATRPRTRGDCVDGPRPCPWVSCRHHLLTDVDNRGNLSISHPDVLRANGDVDLSAMPHTCALDVADEGGATLEEAGVMLNVTRERVRQLQTGALWNLRPHDKMGDWRPDDADDDERKAGRELWEGKGNVGAKYVRNGSGAEPGEATDDQPTDDMPLERVVAFSRGDEGKWNHHWAGRMYALYAGEPVARGLASPGVAPSVDGDHDAHVRAWRDTWSAERTRTEHLEHVLEERTRR
jgi:hypothetical protein